MTRRILFRPEAEAELVEAAKWYEERGKGLGADFLRAVDVAIAAIERHPFAYRKVFGEVRRVLLRRFPYGVIYAVTDDEIVILACMHGRRDPRRWKERVKP
jgi:plasmid stabilization system protein ParE